MVHFSKIVELAGEYNARYFVLDTATSPSQMPCLSWRTLSAHVPRKGATCSCKKRTVIGKHFYKSLQYNQWSAKRNSWSTCFQNAILIL